MTPLKAINDLLRHQSPLRAALTEAYDRFLGSGWYVLGAEVSSFEREFAAYCGAEHAIGVANGTEALELALRALDVERGQTVGLVANAGGYGTTAVLAVGAQPRYVDVEADTLSMSVSALEQALAPGDVAAVIVTHLYGRLAKIEEIAQVCQRHGVKLLEDCAQAHGARRGGRVAGSWGDAAAFSFYPTKNLGALGDGGAVVCGSEAVAARVRQLRQYGWAKKYHSAVPDGRNSRLDELQAAFLRVKLPHLDGWNARRGAIAARYQAAIDHPKLSLPALLGADDVAHLYVLRCPERDSLAAHLVAEQVPFDVHYPLPDYRQPMLGARFAQTALPVTEQACREVLTLPCFPEMTDEEVDWVAAAVNRWRP